jgi:acetoacetyl-CoA synthetase
MLKNEIWQHPDISRTQIYNFIKYCEKNYSLNYTNYDSLYDWSLNCRAEFWKAVSEFCNVVFHTKPSEILVDDGIIYNSSWFINSTINYAEHFLIPSSKAIVHGWNENGPTISYSVFELRKIVGSIQQFLKTFGSLEKERVVAIVQNQPETLATMLGVTSVGGIWSSCSPELGSDAIFSRFEQIKPKILVFTDSYLLKGQRIDIRDTIINLLERLTSVKILIHIKDEFDINLKSIKNGIKYYTYYNITKNPIEPTFKPFPFDHPLFILFSSGTTGLPKCIIHSAGGTLIEHLKEHILHTDLNSGDTIFYQTGCSWMMWNWLISALTAGSSIVLYDGWPFQNNGDILFELADRTKCKIFGTNPRFLSLLDKHYPQQNRKHELLYLETLLSTGSVLSPEHYDIIYQKIKPNIQISSISGGTDILGCFLLGTPLKPVIKGELQCQSLGIATKIFDYNGHEITAPYIKGELVSVNSFPSMPLGFWNDPENRKYHSTYFSKFPNVWHHGDYVAKTNSNGMIIYGRSDCVLNPNGIRIGTAEIYRVLEQIPEIVESVAVSYIDECERILLLVVIKGNIPLTPELESQIRNQLKIKASAAHVPKKIIQVTDIPKTGNGKIAEKIVQQIVNKDVNINTITLANPECIIEIKKRTLV